MFHSFIHPSIHSFIVFKMCNISTVNQECYLWQWNIPAIVLVVETRPIIQGQSWTLQCILLEMYDLAKEPYKKAQ